MLLDCSADPDSLDAHGRRALHDAVFAEHKECVDILIRAGASQICFSTAENSLTALGLAIFNRRAIMTRFLATHELVDVNETFHFNDNHNPLTLAVSCSNDELPCVEALLKSNTLQIDKAHECSGIERVNALTIAVDLGYLNLVKVLLAHGADPDHLYAGHLIPLLVLAAGRGHTRILRALLAAGADINARDQEDHTALWTAQEYKMTACANALRLEMAKQTPTVETAETVDEEAARLAAAERGRRRLGLRNLPRPWHVFLAPNRRTRGAFS